MNIDKLIQRTAIAVFLLCVVGIAQAQQPWDTNVITWTAPTTCVDGRPISACPLTGYRVERAAISAGTFASLATVTGVTHTHTGAIAGVNCYRVVALSATGNSDPSNVACKTNVQPPSPPNPPTGLTVAALVAGANVTPAYRILADGSRSSPYYALVPVGTSCAGPVAFTYRGKPHRRVTVQPSALVGTTDGRNLAAPCS